MWRKLCFNKKYENVNYEKQGYNVIFLAIGGIIYEREGYEFRSGERHQ